jgi:hypothetical protein
MSAFCGHEDGTAAQKKCSIFAVIGRKDQKHGPAIVRSVGDDGAVHRAAYGGRSPIRNCQRSRNFQSMGTSRSSHCAARFLICSKFRIAGSPLRMIVARLRSLGTKIIARDTAERSFIVP